VLTLLACPAPLPPLYPHQVRTWALDSGAYALLAPSARTAQSNLPSAGQGWVGLRSGSSPSGGDQQPAVGFTVVVEENCWPGCCSRGSNPGEELGWEASSSGRPGSNCAGTAEFVPWQVVDRDELLLRRVRWAKLKSKGRALEKIHRSERLCVAVRLWMVCLGPLELDRLMVGLCYGVQVLQHGRGQAAGCV
jgi:hypothetical protein